MARVFLVQNPSRRDPISGEWVPKFDLSAAERAGDIVEMIPPGPDFEDPDALRRRLAAHLIGAHGYQTRDFLLALGDPIAIAIAMHLALCNARSCTVLKFDRQERAYRPVRIAI